MLKIFRHASRCPFLWDLTPYHWMIGAWRCERALWFYLQGSRWDFSCTFLPLKMRPPCLETSGANHAVPLRRIPEERRPQLHRRRSLKTRNYNRHISTKSPSFWMKTFSASLTNITVLLPQSHVCSCYVNRSVLAPPPLGLQKHTDLWAHDYAQSSNCDIRLSSLTLPAPEAGAFMEWIVLYISLSMVVESCRINSMCAYTHVGLLCAYKYTYIVCVGWVVGRITPFIKSVTWKILERKPHANRWVS